MIADLNKIKARLGSITGQTIPHPLRESANKLLFQDIPEMIREIEESRASLAAKQRTIHDFVPLDSVLYVNDEVVPVESTALYLVAPVRDYRP
jgi:hypothetical protein